MNWIAGIYNLDGQPVNPELLQQLMAPARSNGSTGCRQWVEGAIGTITYGRTTEEQAVKADSLLCSDGRFCIGFDGQIYNRRELLDRIRPGLRDLNGSAGELVAAAYEMWGTECLDKIDGDFAFSLWDKHQERLVCARDVFGVRSLFYCLDGKRLIWASRLRQLLGCVQISRTLEKEYLANYLVRLSLPLAVTPYKEIKRLEPAHSLVVDRGRVSIERYWKPDPSKRIFYSTGQQYAEHFREVFREAVDTRLSGDGPVWCELSGGLDSSSITCMAQELVDEGRSSIKSLGTLSWVYDAAYYSDERIWMRAVVEKCGVAAHYISCDEYYPLQHFGRSSAQWDEPSFQNIFDSLLERIREMLRQSDVKVVLSGIAGDQTVTPGHCPVYIADLFRKFQFGQVATELLRWQKDLKLPFANLFMNSCARPLLHRDLVQFEAELESIRNPVPAWIDASFAKTTGMRERALCRLVSPPYRSPAFQSHCEHIMETSEILWRGEREDVCEHRYPYLDRRLVEFCLAVPWTELFPPGEPKSLVRRALNGTLPEKIRTRMGGKEPTHAFFLALRKDWPRLEQRLQNPRLAELGCIDPDAFHHALKLARAGYTATSPLLLATLSLENWLTNAGM